MVLNAVLGHVDNVTYGSIITYECVQGHVFEPGVKVRAITCDETETWQPMLSACQDLNNTTYEDNANEAIHRFIK